MRPGCSISSSNTSSRSVIGNASLAQTGGHSLLILGIGNPMRGDDGVGPYVVEQLERSMGPGIAFHTSFQLLPEHAESMAGVDCCIIVDASIEASDVLIEELIPEETQGPGLHGFSIQNIFAMAVELFNAHTRVFLCHVPASNLSHGTELSAYASEAAQKAIDMLQDFIRCW